MISKSVNLATLLVEVNRMFAPFKQAAEKFADKKYHEIWIRIIRLAIRMGDPTAILNALTRATVWLSTGVSSIPTKENLLGVVEPRFKTMVSRDILEAIVTPPTSLERIEFILDTPRVLFGADDVANGKLFDDAYLAKNGFAKCASFDIFLIMNADGFSLRHERVLVWSDPLEHSQFVAPSVFELSQVLAKGPGAEVANFGNLISYGLSAINMDKIDPDTPIILRVLPVQPPAPAAPASSASAES